PDGHWLFKITALPTVPNASLYFPAICERCFVIKPVVKESGLIVMAPGALPHKDRQHIAKVCRRFWIGGDTAYPSNIFCGFANSRLFRMLLCCLCPQADATFEEQHRPAERKGNAQKSPPRFE